MRNMICLLMISLLIDDRTIFLDLKSPVIFILHGCVTAWLVKAEDNIRSKRINRCSITRKELSQFG